MIMLLWLFTRSVAGIKVRLHNAHLLKPCQHAARCNILEHFTCLITFTFGIAAFKLA